MWSLTMVWENTRALKRTRTDCCLTHRDHSGGSPPFSRLIAAVWASSGVRPSYGWEVRDSGEHLATCCDRRPLIWRRCEGAFPGVSCPGTSPRWTLCRWAGSCKGWRPRRTAPNTSGKLCTAEGYTDRTLTLSEQFPSYTAPSLNTCDK